MVNLGVVFWCPSDQGVLFHKHDYHKNEYHVYETVLLGHWGTEIVPLRIPYYGQSNSAPRGTVSIPFFLSGWYCYCTGKVVTIKIFASLQFKDKLGGLWLDPIKADIVTQNSFNIMNPSIPHHHQLSILSFPISHKKVVFFEEIKPDYFKVIHIL